MIWTREVPTIEGWYWFRDEKWNNPDLKQIKCVFIEMHPTLGALIRDGRLPFIAADWPGHWAGPIPKPKEKKK